MIFICGLVGTLLKFDNDDRLGGLICIEAGDTEVNGTDEETDIELGDADEHVDSEEEADLRDLVGIVLVNFGDIGVASTGIATDALEVALLSLCSTLFLLLLFSFRVHFLSDFTL